MTDSTRFGSAHSTVRIRTVCSLGRAFYEGQACTADLLTEVASIVSSSTAPTMRLREGRRGRVPVLLGSTGTSRTTKAASSFGGTSTRERHRSVACTTEELHLGSF